MGRSKGEGRSGVGGWTRENGLVEGKLVESCGRSPLWARSSAGVSVERLLSSSRSARRSPPLQSYVLKKCQISERDSSAKQRLLWSQALAVRTPVQQATFCSTRAAS